MPPCVHGPYIPIECRWTLLDVSIVLSGFLIDRLSIPHISFLRIKINKNLSVRSIWILYILLPFGNCVSWTVFGFPFVFCCLAISRICARDSLSTLARIGIMSISAQNRHSTLICCLGKKRNSRLVTSSSLSERYNTFRTRTFGWSRPLILEGDRSIARG